MLSLPGSERSTVHRKIVVNMATVAPGYSERLAGAVEASGGRYVEAPLSGSRTPAEAGAPVVLSAATAETVIDGVQPLLAIGKATLRWGVPPNADAATAAVEDGRELEVIDLRTLSPLDLGPVYESVRRAERCIVVHEAPGNVGLGAEIAARVAERCFYSLPTAKRDVLTTGNHQAGTWAVDFTDPTAPQTVAWSDPPPIDPENLTLGGAWGSYWYNGFIYETNITEGLNIFRLSDSATAGARRIPFLNPQTQLGPVG